MEKIDDAVLEYMKSQNRPYSALDVFNNLHKKYGKTAIVKTLEGLSEKNMLLEKTYGKSKIYVVHQSLFPVVSSTEMKEIDDKILQLDALLKESQSELTALNMELKSVTSTLTTQDALVLLKKLSTEVNDLEEHLAPMKANFVCVDANEKQKLTEKCKSVVSHWKKRKRMTNDLMNAVLEGYPKSKKQFLDEVGLETDEDYQVSIPSS